MARDNGTDWGSVFVGVIVGAFVGGTLAILFAPKSGVALRSDIGDAVDDLKVRAEDTLDTLQARTTELVNRSKAILEETRENIAQSVEVGKEAYVTKKAELTAELEA